MLALVLAIWLPLAAVAFIAWPFIRRRGRRFESFRATHLQELLDQRETLLHGLGELENDRALGNLGEDEYRRLREDYERQAASVLKALDARTNGVAADVAAEIAAAKARLEGKA